MIYTIGYKGLTIDEYLNILTANNVKILCDLRYNAVARGNHDFSKKRLADRLGQQGIEYIHIRELGITSPRRRDANSVEGGLEKLFQEYSAELPRYQQELQKLEDLHSQHHNIALTCVEHNPQECHRTWVSDYLNATRGLEVRHL